MNALLTSLILGGIAGLVAWLFMQGVFSDDNEDD